MADTAAANRLQELTRSQMEVDDGVDEETKKKNKLERTLCTRLAQGCAVASAVLAVLAIVLSDVKSVTIVAGIIAVGVSGLVIYQEELLQDTDSEFTYMLPL
jgi:hypothetical protein